MTVAAEFQDAHIAEWIDAERTAGRPAAYLACVAEVVQAYGGSAYVDGGTVKMITSRGERYTVETLQAAYAALGFQSA